MQITVSGERREVPNDMTLVRLIRLARVENPDYVTVAVNDVFVDGKDLETFELHEGDRVEFLYFMGGGA
ncbi:sulfur carrier protein ThiS [Sutterella sp.]|uniref:sulfur carrier protein ThiS n=1 Tax=Sutterella sp. TaxID=1981025 RepID=UPI0026E038DB|nr:sulfur carrier protein ThiS [Sutterella sp.]MDO5531469.1 sulfur carrier protein ThiS [Sutterella sp.]